MRVGFIGLGMMGKGMAANLQKAGFGLCGTPVPPERPTRSREGHQTNKTPTHRAFSMRIALNSVKVSPLFF